VEFLHANWFHKPCHLVLIGFAGIGKTHLATAICHNAILKGYQTVVVSLFDLTAKLSKAKNLYSLIDFYAKVPLLCLDELGYALHSKEQADALFQIIFKRSEIATTLVTTNLIPSGWGKIFDSATVLDRLSMSGSFITLEGKSYRRKK
jgi:DNA replication protein DnaC